MCYINRWVQTELWLIDLIQQSHNAPVPCPTMHHSGTEMCTCAHISVTLVVKCLYNTIIVLQPTHRHCIGSSRFSYCHITCNIASHQTVPQIAKFMGPTWSPPRSCRWSCRPLPLFLLSHYMQYCITSDCTPDSKVHGANMEPTSVLSAPDGLHVGPMNLAISLCYKEVPLHFNQHITQL